MLLAVLVMTPAAAFAQQENAAQGQNPQAQSQQSQEPAPAKTEAAQGKTDGAPAQAQENDPKVISGMSILGNQEAPKALVIVPWKRSGLGNGLSISTLLDDSKLPIDKEVFMRMLNYYEIRSDAPGGAATRMDSAPVSTTAQRRNQ
jgi:hypothetical protein